MHVIVKRLNHPVNLTSFTAGLDDVHINVGSYFFEDSLSSAFLKLPWVGKIEEVEGFVYGDGWLP